MIGNAVRTPACRFGSPAALGMAPIDAFQRLRMEMPLLVRLIDSQVKPAKGLFLNKSVNHGGRLCARGVGEMV